MSSEGQAETHSKTLGAQDAHHTVQAPFVRPAADLSRDGLSAPAHRITAVISDIDGTLVRPDKSLSAATVAAVKALNDAGIAFTLASARPPRGLQGYVEALSLSAPLVAYNGGNIVTVDMKVLDAFPLPPDAAREALDMLAQRGIDAWVFTHGEWRILRIDGDYVDLEERTIGYGPTLVDRFDDLGAVDKIVGACKDEAKLARAGEEIGAALQGRLTVGLSQSYYLDITHPDANKGVAAQAIAKHLGIPLNELAVLGDMSNDVAMFRQAGLAIAMGQASDSVKSHAHAVTLSNADDGVAAAIYALILPRAPGAAEAGGA